MVATGAKFERLPSNTSLAAGLVLRTISENGELLDRITHVFSANVYLIRIGGPSQARDARRPRRISRGQIQLSLKKKELSIGRVALPSEFSTEPDADSEEAKKQDAAWEALQPLVGKFESEPKLGRSSFTREIVEHAEKKGWSATTMRRLLLRYWYFGSVKSSLLERAKGPPLSTVRSADKAALDTIGRKRPGVRSPLEGERGANEFVATGVDIEDMLAAMRRVAEGAEKGSRERGSATIWAAHAEWLHKDFKSRHAAIYRRWMRGQHVLPLSYSQYYRYIKANTDLDDKILAAVAVVGRRRSTNALQCSGPGEVYEIDPTGGQIVLLPTFYADKSWRSYRPIIYVVIDRWSRRIVGIYVSLRPASWEVLRMVLRVSFTSRDRFNSLGMNITDEEWQPGVVPSIVYVDRGPEMIGQQMLDAAVDGLRITGRILPPLTPDGKGIVEKVIGDLKRSMKRNPRLLGQYKKFAQSPQDTASKKQAAKVAVANLFDLYRALLRIALEHNARPHAGLKRLSILKKNGIPPTPNAAYEFGIKHLTGIQRPPLTDGDYDNLTLWSDKATFRADGTIGYRSRNYHPTNAVAKRFRQIHRPGSINIKIDPTLRTEIVVPTNAHPWAKWVVDKAGAQDLRDISDEEEVALADAFQINAARSGDKHLRDKAQASPRGGKAIKSSSQDMDQLRRQRESNRLKNAASGIDEEPPAVSRKGYMSKPSAPSAVDELEAQERARMVEANRKRRSTA